MESRVAGCKVVARISCSITPEHPGGSLDVGTSRFRLLRQDDAVRDAELSRTEAQLRATARQQEAVAHIGQRALAGAPPDELIAGAVAIVARVLEVPFASVLELRPESRTLLLRAGVGWRDGAVGRTVLPTDADSHAGFVLRSTGPVVVEDLATDTRFGSAPLLSAQGVVSSLSVLVHGKARPYGILGVHTAEPREFTIHDTHFLQAVANVLATAIDRARAEEALRRRQERALRENKERLRTVIAGAPLVLFALDGEGVFTMVEGRGLDAVGVRPALLIGRSAFALFADLPQALADVRRALTGETFSSTVEIFGVVFEAWYSPVRDVDGTVAGVIGVGTDISERCRAEAALRRSEESHRALVQHASYAIYRSSVDGRFLTVNPALVRMLGYESEQQLLAVDLAVDIYADPEERQRILGRFEGADVVEGVEVTWRRRDGGEILVRLSGRAVRRPGGAIDCFETIAEDVTERRALEEQLRQSQKMEAIGQLTGGIAHDFNNLLTIILANAQLVAKALPAPQGDAHADLRDVMSAALRGRVMVKELLGFARRSRLDLQSIDLGGLIGDLSGFLRRILPADVEIVTASEEDLPDVRADVHATEQILFNLVTNARDAMPDGGVLRIETRRQHLTEDQRQAWGSVRAGEHLCLSVGDTGVGMDEETRTHMFEPFFTTKPAGKGTGLGLATVYGLVKQHGGGIDVDSEPGKGTRFRIYFPVDERVAPVVRPLPGVAEVRGGLETILVVEDDDRLRRSVKRILEAAGYQIVTAADGLEALEALRQTTGVRLVFSDLVMPRLGGRALYDAARREGHTTPFLFASGYSDPDRAASLDPSVPLLHKPWTEEDLLGRIRAILDREQGAANGTA